MEEIAVFLPKIHPFIKQPQTEEFMQLVAEPKSTWLLLLSHASVYVYAL